MTLPGIQIDQMFENFIGFGEGKKAGGESNDLFSGMMNNILNRVNADEGLTQGKLLNADIRKKSPDLLESIKKYLLSKGISLDQVSADDATLDRLKRFLESAGFKGDAIGRLLGELKSGSFKKGVRLSDVFAKLSELKETRDSDMLLDISAMPYIESILSKLLPESEYQHAALKGVMTEGQGVDLSKLIENLRRIIAQHPEKGRSVPTEADQRQLAGLLAKFGIDSEKGILTLDRFVSGLESMAAKIRMHQSNRRVETAELKGFFDGLKPVDDSGRRLKMVQGLKTDDITQKVFNPGHGDKNPRALLETEGRAADNRILRPQGEAVKATEAANDVKNTVTPAENGSGTHKTAPRIFGPEPRAEARTLPAYVLNQVGRQIIRSHQNGMNQLVLQLKPPHLGRLQMQINHSGDMIRVSIVTEQIAAREILMSHAGELRTHLTEQGMRVEKIDIQFDQSFDQSMANARNESNRSNERRQQGARSIPGSHPAEAVSEESPQPIRVREGILDLVA
ncbi:MAG TPA: hypothetical protein HPQ03_02940 [Deltaproteobacteria bacterium]|nr:hypothetical protein [Deltaproteobacteria bacterium]